MCIAVSVVELDAAGPHLFRQNALDLIDGGSHPLGVIWE